jgi:hypothetical protein
MTTSVGVEKTKWRSTLAAAVVKWVGGSLTTTCGGTILSF